MAKDKYKIGKYYKNLGTYQGNGIWESAKEEKEWAHSNDSNKQDLGEKIISSGRLKKIAPYVLGAATVLSTSTAIGSHVNLAHLKAEHVNKTSAYETADSEYQEQRAAYDKRFTDAERVYDGKVMPAYWDTPEYRNNTNNINLNANENSLKDSILGIYDEIMTESKNNPPLTKMKIPDLTPDLQRLSNLFQDIVKEGFKNDELSNKMPFNFAYFEKQINELVKNYFAPSEVGAGGFQSEDGIFVGTGNQTPERFTEFAIHELGHKLGLGDAWTQLLAELYMGYDKPQNSIRSYNTAPERVLVETVGIEKAFEAAFSSNEAIEKLWDENIKGISYNDVQMIRSSINRLGKNRNDQDRELREKFGKYIGMSDELISANGLYNPFSITEDIWNLLLTGLGTKNEYNDFVAINENPFLANIPLPSGVNLYKSGISRGDESVILTGAKVSNLGKEYAVTAVKSFINSIKSFSDENNLMLTPEIAVFDPYLGGFKSNANRNLEQGAKAVEQALGDKEVSAGKVKTAGAQTSAATGAAAACLTAMIIRLIQKSREKQIGSAYPTGNPGEFSVGNKTFIKSDAGTFSYCHPEKGWVFAPNQKELESIYNTIFSTKNDKAIKSNNQDEISR